MRGRETEKDRESERGVVREIQIDQIDISNRNYLYITLEGTDC